MKMKNAARSFTLVYFMLSALNFIILLIIGTEIIDAICLSLTTISTGGISLSDTSLMESSFSLQAVTLVFMFIGGTNFYVHFKTIYGRDIKALLTNKEIRYMALYFLIIALILFLMKVGSLSVLFNNYEDYFIQFWDILFTVVSMGTTTGASSFDYTQSSEIVMFLLIILMMVGASAGSTSGGIKFSRIRIVIRYFLNTLNNILHPNAVYSIKVDNESIDDTRVMSAVSVTLLYIVTMILSMFILMATGLNWVDSIGLAVGSITNTGVGFGNFGPTGDYDLLSTEVKVFLMLLMWIGRLEITLALVFFTPGFWRELRYAYRSSRLHRKLLSQ